MGCTDLATSDVCFAVHQYRTALAAAGWSQADVRAVTDSHVRDHQ